MKTVRRYSALLVAFFTVSFVLNAQKGIEDGSRYGHGEDSIRCIKNFSLYREYVKQGAFRDAYPFWKICFSECPLVSKNLYIDGARMLKEFIESEKSEQRSQVLIDSLMMLYKQRIKWFPSDDGRVNGYIGIDLLRYRRNDLDVIADAITYLERELDLMKIHSTPATMATYMTSTVTLFTNNRITADVVIKNYAKVIDLVDLALVAKPNDSDLKMVKENVEQNFAASGAATCTSLVALFEPQYEKNKANVEYLKKVTELLRNTNCVETALFRKASESLLPLEPSAEAAYNVAKLFKMNNNIEKYAQYLRQAIEMQTNLTEKSKYYVELGDVTFRDFGNSSLARDYARMAIQADPNSGYPYLLIGNIYVSNRSCGDDDFKKAAIYWLAVDQFIKAKNLDPELKEIADKSISQYSAYFPDVEAIFFNGYKEGDEYTVECWINEKTRVRAR